MAGIDTKYNSLLEAYYIIAMNKKTSIEVKKNLALIKAAFYKEPEPVQEAISKYLEEALPAIKEQRAEFVEMAQSILQKEAGKIINLSEYEAADS